MNPVLTETPLATCHWCGRENQERLAFCAGCRTPLAAEPPPTEPEEGAEEVKRKSRMLAVGLALIFGPLGLLYVKAWGTMLVTMIIGVSCYLTQTGGIWVPIGLRIVCAAVANYLVLEQHEGPDLDRNSFRLLDEAARLEGVDRSKAIAAYEEIVRQYPDTSASREASKAIQVLTRTT